MLHSLVIDVAVCYFYYMIRLRSNVLSSRRTNVDSEWASDAFNNDVWLTQRQTLGALDNVMS